MQTIFLVLPQFSNISNVIRGKCIEALSKKMRVVVITPFLDREAAITGGYFSHENVSYLKYDLAHPRFWLIFNRYIRKAFLREYDDWKFIQHWEYGQSNPPSVRIFIKIGSILPKRFFGPPLFTFLERIFLPLPARIKELVGSYKPALVVVARPGYSPIEAEFVVSAKKLGIPTAAIDINFDNPHSFVKLLRNTDYISVWNETMKNELEKYNHFPSGSSYVAGSLRFDHYFNDAKEGLVRPREDFIRSKNLDPAKKTIVYITQTPTNYPPRKDFARELIRLKKEGRFAGDPNILVRIHPYDVFADYNEFLGTPGIHIERAGHSKINDASTKAYKIEMDRGDMANLTETLLYSDVVINLASTLIIEGCIFDKQSVSIGFPKSYKAIGIWALHEFEDVKEMMRMGNIPIASTPEELAQLVNVYLDNPKLLCEQRAEIVKKYVYCTDGLAWKRTADFIGEIIEREEKKLSSR